MKYRRYLRQSLEVTWLSIAIYILKHRNVNRSRVISRHDNNELDYIGDTVERVRANILCEYKNN